MTGYMNAPDTEPMLGDFVEWWDGTEVQVHWVAPPNDSFQNNSFDEKLFLTNREKMKFLRRGTLPATPEQQIATLTARVAELERFCTHAGILAAQAEHNALRDRCGELEKDAARYRWLKADRDNIDSVAMCSHDHEARLVDNVDQIIDERLSHADGEQHA
jgi:hypothetical protein